MASVREPPIRRASAATVLVFASRLVRSAGRLLLLVATARAFSVEDFATFSFDFALGALLGVVSDGGLSEYVSREISAAGFSHPGLEHKALRTRTTMFVALVALAFFVQLVVAGPRALGGVGPLLAGAGFTLVDFISSTARANARYDLDTKYNTAFFVGLLGFLGAAYACRLSYFSFQLGLAAVVAVLLLVLVLRRLRVLRAAAGEPYPGTATGLLKQARWFLLRSLMSWSFSDLPIVLLRELSTSLQVSLFSLAMRSVGFVTQLFVVIGFVFYPALSNARSVSRPAFAKKIVDFVLLNTYVMPLAFGACLVGGAILIGVAGPAYRAAWLVLEVLAFAHVLSLGGFSGMPLVAAGAEKAVAKVMLASLLIFAGTAAWLMPILGALGGAVALLGCFFVAKLALLVLYRRGGIPLGGRAFALPFLSFGGLLIASLALPATLKIALLLALGLLSGVLTFRTLRRVAIF